MYILNTYLILTQIADTAATARSLCTKLGKPSEADARTLSSLFPSTSGAKRTYSKAFNPLDRCVVSKQKQQKKSTRIKPRKVPVVMIRDQEYDKVPRGHKRRVLLQDGFIKELEFLRNMSSQQVRNTVIRGFSDKVTGKPVVTFLTADPKLHVLTKVEEQESGANGADVLSLAGQGSLYIRIAVSGV